MKLFYRKYGSGPPLIILHGLFGSSDNWITFSKNLADIYTVYLPDLRNHGQSPHSNVIDYESMSEDLYNLALELNLNKFFLAGHSMGGKTAVSFTLRWPEMINGLLIADISPFVNGKARDDEYNHHLAILDAIIACDLSLISSRAEAESVLAEKITSEKDRGLILKNLHRTSGKSFEWRINAFAIRNNMWKLMEGIDRGANDNNPVTGFPVIFLRGGKSDYLAEDDYRDILTTFPAAEFITISAAGHWIQADQPDEVAAIFRKLLNEF